MNKLSIENIMREIKTDSISNEKIEDIIRSLYKKSKTIIEDDIITLDEAMKIKQEEIIARDINYLLCNWQLNYYHDFYSRGKGSKIIKRCIRRMLLFLIGPIVDKQNCVNNALVELVIIQHGEIEELKKQIEK